MSNTYPSLDTVLASTQFRPTTASHTTFAVSTDPDCDLPTADNPPRKSHKAPNLLTNFRSLRFPDCKPRYESIRLIVFQGFLQALHFVDTGTAPRVDWPYGFSPTDQNACERWAAFQSYVLANRSVLHLVSIHQSQMVTGNCSKKYSPFYILKVVKNVTNREAMRLYTEALFGDCCEQRMEKVFRARVMGEPWEREERWGKLVNTLLNELVRNH